MLPMQKRMSELSWDDLRIFLAVARTGSLGRASTVLGLSQPTVGRRIAALEAELGARLVERLPTGQAISAAGASVLANVERMETEAMLLERQVAGRDAGLAGVVRVATDDWFAARILAPVLSEFSAEHPAVSVELLTDNRSTSLVRREIDLAFRFAPFKDADVRERVVAEVPHAVFASRAYLDRAGTPDASNLTGHAIVICSDDESWPTERGWWGDIPGEPRIAVRASSREAQSQLCAAGGGLALLPRCLADKTGGLVERPLIDVPPRQVWLGVQRDVGRIPRVRALIDAAVRGLRLSGYLKPEQDQAE